MFIYSYKTKRDAVSAIFEIAEGRRSEISLLTGRLSAVRDNESLDISSLPIEVIAGGVGASSADDLFHAYEESGAKGIFLSFELFSGVIFRLIFFGDVSMIVISIVSRTHIVMGVPDDIEAILYGHGVMKDKPFSDI